VPYDEYTGKVPTPQGGLSAAAQSILDSYRRVNPGTGANVPMLFANKVEAAYSNGEITQAEADYLLRLFGF